MFVTVGIEEAEALFEQLQPAQRLFSLSPGYAAVDAVRDSSLQQICMVYREGEVFWLHCAHRGSVLNTEFRDLQSPYGYGGPLASTNDTAFLARAWAAYSEWCKRAGIVAEFVRFHPLARNWHFYGGEVRDNRDTVAVPLRADRSPLAGYQTRCRTAVRKATSAGVIPVWLDLAANISRFGDFYRTGMAFIGAEAFYSFSDDYFTALAALNGVRLLACCRDGEWLSAGIFLSGADCLEYHLSAASQCGRELGATNLLVHAAAERAREDGLTWLYLGGGTDSRNDNSLLFFKAGFSNSRSPFRIGFAIHDSETYARLKQYTSGRAASSNILFYRS